MPASQPALPEENGTVTQADYESLKAAAEWYARLQDHDADPRLRAAWERWLDARPEHRRAWSHVEAVSQRFAPLRAEGERDAAAQAVTGVSRRLSSRREAARRMLALGGMGALGWLAWRLTPLPAVVTAWRSDIATGIGEQRDVVLADGTRIWLNTGSAVDIDFNADVRLVTLAMGEIFIETAPDLQHRSFFVDTRSGRLQALGTRFAVKQADDDVLLAVYEGQVRIRDLAGNDAVVAAGEQRRFSARGIAAAAPVDPAREAWTRGVILAQDLPLGELVAELRRYHPGHIGVDPRIAGLRVVGRYPAADLDRTLSMIERDLPLRVNKTFPWWVTLESR